ncbi:hypothetical protein Btru_023857, partial [Bulinus truncatus]
QMYDAKKSAEETDIKLKQDLVEIKRAKHEQIERARIRGNEALQKEILKHDLGDMLKDLSLLQKKDRRRRQGIVSDLPKQVFIPPEKCLEERQERQKEMEAKFDELYLQHCRPKYRLSPNEVERLVKEERERRRKLRILQVREQAKTNAASIRNDVQREKNKILQNMAKEIKDKLEAEKKEKLRHLEQKYENTLHSIGEGHKEAHIYRDQENRSEKLKKLQEEELAAQERFKQALELKKKLDTEKEYELNKHILARKAALEMEKERALQIASLPPPPPDISVEFEKGKKKAIPMMDMKAYATTHFHIPDYHVVKAGIEEQQMYDAKKSAEETDIKLKQDLVEIKRAKHEQIERARIRGNEALQKEILKHDLGDMLKDLSLLQKKDRRRRQGIVSDLPKQVFIPPEKCLEERQERQKEMEAKFDELYLQHCKVDTDDVHSMDVSEYLTTSDSVETSTADATPDISIPISRINPALRDLTNVAKQAEQAQIKKPETVLRQLLNRIKEQREDSKQICTASGVAAVASDADRLTTETKVSGEVQTEAKVVSSKPGLETDVTGAETRHNTDFQKNEKDIEKKEKEQDKGAVAVNAKPEASSIQSDIDKVTISNNNKMIEDLLKRIQLIEAQKEHLSKQFLSHAGFYNKLVNDDVIDLDLTDCSSLKEMDIESKDDVPIKNAHQDIPDKDTPGFRIKSTTSEVFSGHVPKAAVGEMNENFIDRKLLESSKLYKTAAPAGNQDEVDLNKKFILHENRVTFDLSSGQTTVHQYHDPTSASRPVGTEGSVGKCFSCDVSRKLLDYTEKVKEKQAVLDEETTRRVREYQRKLFETHEERKKLLSEVRADIEKRRQELKLAPPKFVEDTGKNVTSFTQPASSYQEDMRKVQQKAWEPIKPFIAEIRHEPAASRFREDPYYAWLGSSGEQSRAAVLNKDEKKMDRDIENKKMDKIRRSLPFQEGDDSLSITWNDTPASRCSQDFSNSSRIFSSEEDRGSPILSEKSKQSDNESFSALLVARAAESRKGFQHRQDEIQSQLIEIQRQKDAIKERYTAGQYALQQQQMALKSKLAQVVAPSGEISGQLVFKEKLDSALGGPILHRSWEVLSAPGSDRPGSTGFNDSRTSDAASGRFSFGTPGNLSADSYLADISYHKIKSTTDVKSLPTSAFFSKDSSQSSHIAKPVVMSVSSQQPTWASLLTSSSNSLAGPLGYPQSVKQDFSQQTSSYGLRQGDWVLPTPFQPAFETYSTRQATMFESVKDVMESLTSQPTQVSMLSSPGLSEHQPHELSTILEVETPLSIAGKVSVKKPNPLSSAASSNTSGANSNQFFRNDPEFIVDVFKESYTLPAGSDATAVNSVPAFHLTRSQKNQVEEMDHSQKGKMKEIDQLLIVSKLGAKRTLNFSEDPKFTPQKFDVADLTDEEDLSLTRMPALVGLTPIRPISKHGSVSLENQDLPEQPDDSAPLTDDRLSSINITGNSDSLKVYSINETGSSTHDHSDRETKGDDVMGMENALDSLLISDALLQAQEFDPMLVWRLQQQSKAVFGDSMDNTAGTSGISDYLTTSVSAELEEITISETNTTNDEINN